MKLSIIALATAVALQGCGLFGRDLDVMGRVRVELVDAPTLDITEAFVSIMRVELLTEDGEALLLSDEVQEFDLLRLRDGVSATLAETEIPEGRYWQLRVVVDEEASLRFEDGSVSKLRVPSGTETGIKVLFPQFELESERDLVVLTIDFDVEQSFVRAGSSGFYLFKPVIKPESIQKNGEKVQLDTNS